MTLWEILKANKTGIAPDMFTMLAASKMNGGRDILHELSGIPPLSFTAKGKPLTAWSITGNTVQNGTPTPENPVEVQAVGDRTANLFDYSTITTGYRIIWTTGADYADNTAMMSDYIKVKNTTYICSNKAVIICYDGNKNYLGALNNSMVAEKEAGTFYGRFTINDNECKFIKLLAYQGAVIGNKTMLNEGSTALPYEPYGYKIPVVTSADGTEPITTPIYLPTPLYSGEVMRSEGSRDVKWGVVDLGSLTWENEFDLSQGQIRAGNLLNPIILTMVYGGNCYCQSYMYDGIKKYTEIKNNSIAFSNSKQIPFLRLKNTSYDNAQDLINSMSGVKLYYELAKPTTETFTAPQIPTLNGTTVIDVDTAVKPERMTIKYRR